jgi:CheY-like chemotaxis protein
MRKTILIVEDDPELQELYLVMLENEGHQILQVADGKEALETLKSVKPDLILLDVILDEMMGDELFVKLKQNARTAETPVVLVTVLPVERCQPLLEVDPATMFLRKPFRRSELVEVVEKGFAQSLMREDGGNDCR